MKMEKELIESTKELSTALKKHIKETDDDSPLVLQTEDGVFECGSVDEVIKIIVAKIMSESIKLE